MKAEDVTATLEMALDASGLDKARVLHRPRLLSHARSAGDERRGRPRDRRSGRPRHDDDAEEIAADTTEVLPPHEESACRMGSTASILWALRTNSNRGFGRWSSG
jgi:hypothetical protein